jgi:hypothetical protein
MHESCEHNFCDFGFTSQELAKIGIWNAKDTGFGVDFEVDQHSFLRQEISISDGFAGRVPIDDLLTPRNKWDRYARLSLEHNEEIDSTVTPCIKRRVLRKLLNLPLPHTERNEVFRQQRSDSKFASPRIACDQSPLCALFSAESAASGVGNWNKNGVASTYNPL